MKTIECWKKNRAFTDSLSVDGVWYDINCEDGVCKRSISPVQTNRVKCTLPELLTEYLDRPEIISEIIELTGYDLGVQCYDSPGSVYWLCGGGHQIILYGTCGFESVQGESPEANVTAPCTLADVLTSEPGRKHAAAIHDFIARVHAAEVEPVKRDESAIDTTLEQRFWLVWNAKTKFTEYRHKTHDSARVECERLARLNPTGEFFILEAVGRFRQLPRYELVEIDVVDRDEIPF